MTRRERVLSSLEHQQPDSVPIDFGSHRSSGISAITYGKLKKELGINSGDIYVYDVIQQLAIVEEPILDAFDVDLVEMGRGFLQSEDEWQAWILPDGTPCKIPAYVDIEQRGSAIYLKSAEGLDLGIMKEGCLYFEQIHWPLMDRDMEEEGFSDLKERLPETMWTGIPSPGAHLSLDEDGLRKLAAGARKLRESTDRAIVGLFGGNLFEVPQFLYRIDNYLTNMGLYPEKIEGLSQQLTEIHLANLELWLGAVGPYIDIILFGDDLGGQNGPLMSPDMYRTYYKPYHSILWNRAKELADVKVQLHTCGGIEPLIDDLIEAGLDAFNPVQVSSNGMDPRHLKDTFGDRITFWGGGCDTRSILPKGSPEEVADHVQEQLGVLAPGGGFIFQQVHNILADVPVKNIMAMFEAVKSYKL